MGERSNVHRVRCIGGPLDGHAFTFRSSDPAPPAMIEIDLADGAGTVTYLRITPEPPEWPNDAWEYVALPRTSLRPGKAMPSNGNGT